MTSKKTPPMELTGMPFDEALARLLQTNPAEIANELATVKTQREEVRKNAEARKEFARSRGRPGGKRFRL